VLKATSNGFTRTADSGPTLAGLVVPLAEPFAAVAAVGGGAAVVAFLAPRLPEEVLTTGAGGGDADEDGDDSAAVAGEGAVFLGRPLSFLATGSADVDVDADAEASGDGKVSSCWGIIVRLRLPFGGIVVVVIVV
jgi:hypothetical protein